MTGGHGIRKPRVRDRSPNPTAYAHARRLSYQSAPPRICLPSLFCDCSSWLCGVSSRRPWPPESRANDLSGRTFRSGAKVDMAFANFSQPDSISSGCVRVNCANPMNILIFIKSSEGRWRFFSTPLGERKAFATHTLEPQADRTTTHTPSASGKLGEQRCTLSGDQQRCARRRAQRPGFFVAP